MAFPSLSDYKRYIEENGANKAAAAAQAKADANATEIAKKIDATAVSAIGKSGNINDAVQTAGDYIIFNCGSSNTVI